MDGKQNTQMMLKGINDREVGMISATQFLMEEKGRRLNNMRLLLEDALPVTSAVRRGDNSWEGYSTIDISTDTKRLLVGAENGSVHICQAYQSGPGRTRNTLNVIETGHLYPNSNPTRSSSVSQRCRWHPSSTDMFSSSGGDLYLRIWNAEHLRKPLEKKYGYHNHCFNKYTSIVAAANYNTEAIHIMDLRIGLDHSVVEIHRKPVVKGRLSISPPVEDIVWNPRYPNRLSAAFLHSNTSSPTRIGSDYVYPILSNTLVIYEWDMRCTEKPLFIYSEKDGWSGRAICASLQYSSNGSCLYSLAGGKFIEFNTESGKPSRELDLEAIALRTFDSGLESREFTISSGSSPDCAFIPSSNCLLLVDLNTFERTQTISIPPSTRSSATAVVIDNDRQMVYKTGNRLLVFGPSGIVEEDTPREESAQSTQSARLQRNPYCINMEGL